MTLRQRVTRRHRHDQPHHRHNQTTDSTTMSDSRSREPPRPSPNVIGIEALEAKDVYVSRSVSCASFHPRGFDFFIIPRHLKPKSSHASTAMPPSNSRNHGAICSLHSNPPGLSPLLPLLSFATTDGTDTKNRSGGGRGQAEVDLLGFALRLHLLQVSLVHGRARRLRPRGQPDVRGEGQHSEAGGR